MAEAAALGAVAVLLLLAAGAAALRAVLDGHRLGTPASIAVLAPAAEAARLVRHRGAGGPRAVVAGAGLLLAAVLRVLALPVAGPPLLDGALGAGWFVVADVLQWAAGALLVRPGRVRRYLGRAALLEAPLLLALAAPVVAARSVDVGRVLVAQQHLPVAVQAPVAVLLALLVPAVLVPAVLGRPAGGVGGLLGAAARAAQPVSVAAVVAVLFLGAGGSPGGAVRLATATAVLVVLLVVAAHRVPALPPALIARGAGAVLLPLAAVQLAVVAAVAVLSGGAVP